LALLVDVIAVLEGNRVYVNTHPKGEPRLGSRGLYRTAGGRVDRAPDELPLLWVLNLSDGHHSLLDIAERSALPFAAVRGAAALTLRRVLDAPWTVSPRHVAREVALA
jgi:aminopeptidase-like protein